MRRRRHRPGSWLGVLTAGLVITGTQGACIGFGPDVEPYIIELDSIMAPATHPADATMTVEVHGLTGPTGCYRLDRFERSRTPARLQLTAWGTVDRDAICTQALVPLEETITAEPPFTDPFRIVGLQPDGDSVTTTVEIR